MNNQQCSNCRHWRRGVIGKFFEGIIEDPATKDLVDKDVMQSTMGSCTVFPPKFGVLTAPARAGFYYPVTGQWELCGQYEQQLKEIEENRTTISETVVQDAPPIQDAPAQVPQLQPEKVQLEPKVLQLDIMRPETVVPREIRQPTNAYNFHHYIKNSQPEWVKKLVPGVYKLSFKHPINSYKFCCMVGVDTNDMVWYRLYDVENNNGVLSDVTHYIWDDVYSVDLIQPVS